MGRGKNINLFLMDGEPNGRIKCGIANWTGVAYKIPRTMLDKCTDIKYLKQSGVYFLLGKDDNENPTVYIGQAGIRKNKKSLLLRINEPHNRADEWTEAIMLTTTNNSFGPTEISYLESRFCNMAAEAKRYRVRNGNEPNPGNLTEEKECEMEEFIDNAKIIVGALGHNLFTPYIAHDTKEPVLSFARTKIKARGQRTNEGFVVLKGSEINPGVVKSCPGGAVKARRRYADLIKDNILLEDIPFSSPSAAAAFVGGSSMNGNELWRTEEGIALKDL